MNGSKIRVARRGRPRRDDAKEAVVKVYGRDLDLLKGYAKTQGLTLKATMNKLCYLLANGGEVPARPQLAPQGWRRFF